MSLQLRPSKHQLADLKRIVELGGSRLVEIQAKLSGVHMPPLRPQELLSVVESVVPGSDAERLVRQLLSLQGLISQTGHGIDVVMDGLRAAVGEYGRDEGIELSDWLVVEPAIKVLVANRCVRLAAKAIELSYDYANLLKRARILTDIRPLFSEAADGIEGAVISYTLRLLYDTADGEHELSIALDEADVLSLSQQCDRALAKASTAQALLNEKCGISVAVSGEVVDA